MEALAKKTLPNGMTYEWSGCGWKEIESGGKALILFALGLVFVYLTLAAQYESFVLPFICAASGSRGAVGRGRCAGTARLENNVYCQIGLVMLIALSSKNAILIVEFAEQLRAKESSIEVAAIESGADSPAANCDDVSRIYSGCCAIGAGDRGRKSWAHLCGHNCVRRNDRGGPCSTWFLFRCCMRWCAIWFRRRKSRRGGASSTADSFFCSPHRRLIYTKF